jgi:hypothetical protein
MLEAQRLCWLAHCSVRARSGHSCYFYANFMRHMVGQVGCYVLIFSLESSMVIIITGGFPSGLFFCVLLLFLLFLVF